jgi:hypothetical protein
MRLYAIAALVALIAGLPVSAAAGETFFGKAAYYSGRGDLLFANGQGRQRVTGFAL